MKISSLPVLPEAARPAVPPKPEPASQRGMPGNVDMARDRRTSAGASDDSVTYDRPVTGRDDLTVAGLMQEAEAVHQKLRDLVTALLKHQGLSLEKLEHLDGSGDGEAAIRADLEALLGPEGDLGVEAVSDRIVAFAKALSGGDSSRSGELREAIIQGFREAEAILGSLPDISHQTLDRVMEKLDHWVNEA